MVIKGTADGLILELGASEWHAFLAALATRLLETGAFFRGGKVTLRAGSRIVSVDQLRELQALLAENGLILTAVDTSEPETRQAADMVGATHSPASLARPGAGQRRLAATAADSAPGWEGNGGDHVSGNESISGVIVRRTLRSGQSIHHDGHVVIMGDVNPGAEVVATGDVLVWGRLRGLVHAGAGGDTTARVCALELSPTQLRIGDHIARPPEEDRRRKAAGPEVARVIDGRIFVEVWSKL